MPEEAPARAAARVLVVDDHPAVREGLAGILRAAGYAVVEAMDGEQAVDIALSQQPDLVLMDVLMPGLSGIDATARITARDPAPRVLMLSVDDSPDIVRAALQAGAAGYLTKAATSGSLLLSALQRTAAGEIVFIPAELADALAQDLGSLQSDRGLLTTREEELAALAATGATSSDIAAALSLSPRTVQNHLSSIYRKLGVTSRTQLARMAATRQIGRQAWTGQERAIVLADVVAFANRNTRDQMAARDAFSRVLQEAFTCSGISWPASHLEDRGDGVLIVVPPGDLVGKLAGPFLSFLRDSLERHNTLTSERENLQLRIAIDVGILRIDGLGMSGEAVIRASRLLDAGEFKAAMHSSGAALGVIVSEPTWSMAISQGLNAADLAARQIEVSVKEPETTAWMWFAGDAVPPALRPSTQETGRILSDKSSDAAERAPGTMRYRMLGPLEVRSGEGWTAISAAKWRSVLASLLVSSGQVVSTEALIHELWGETPPSTANNLIAIYVHRLKKTIGDPEGRVLLYRAPGYVLRVPDGATDIQRFENMVREARGALTVGDPGRAVARLSEALGLWRGPLLADVAPSPRIAMEAERLAELRLDAIELEIAAGLACGMHPEVIPEIRRHLAEHPLREGLWLLLMRALDETGRRAEALAAYVQAREVISSELGAEPGAALGRMYADLLADTPARSDLSPCD